MKKIKFALVGCGRIANKHIESICKLEEAKLVSLCDINKERAKKYGEKLHLPYYTDYDEMLRNEDVDVVNILTPSGFHAKHTIDIVKKYQKHIVCEKPMALRLEDADEMINVCNNYGVKLFVIKQNRYNIPIQQLKKYIDEGRFGKLVMGTVRLRWSRKQEYYDMDSWRGTWKMDGGCLTNQASHLIDLLQWLMGKPIEVSAMTATRLADIEVEDTGVAILKFENGALGIIEATTATRPTDIEGSISILGEKGTVEIGGFSANNIKIWKFEDNDSEDMKILEKYNENPPDVYGFGHIRYLRHVIYCIQNKEKPLIDGYEGRKSLELINAIYESAEKGKKVKLNKSSYSCKLGEKNE